LSREPPFLGPARERGDPLFRQGVSRVSVASPDLVSRLCVSASPSLFYFSKERSMAVAHSGNLSLGGVMDTMRAERCVPIRASIQAGASDKTHSVKELKSTGRASILRPRYRS